MRLLPNLGVCACLLMLSGCWYDRVNGWKRDHEFFVDTLVDNAFDWLDGDETEYERELERNEEFFGDRRR